ncbi:MAG: transcriptional activator RfaH [Hyphomicrobiales bacterium]|nr:transcriptional activator RfaH [Hyphomicrobiales bacterium]
MLTDATPTSFCSAAPADDGGAARSTLRPNERWYVAMTLPHKERVAAPQLRNQGYRSFVPLQLVTRRHARQFRTELAPVFPRYLFVILDVERDRWRSVNGTIGVRHLITDGERPIPVVPGVVETLQQSCDPRGALVFDTERMAAGERVRLSAGPLAGTLGVLQGLDGAGRVQLLLDLLGGRVKVTVEREMVAAAR